MGSIVLDFEKPVIELENKIKEMQSISGEIDIDKEIKVLEKKVDTLREEIRLPTKAATSFI